MFAKLGLVILILLFGATLFTAGTMAPENIAQPVRAGGKAVLAWFAKDEQQPSAGDSGNNTQTIAYGTLIPPAGSAESQDYGIQIGLFTTLKEADTAALKLTANNYDFKQVLVRDKLDIDRYLLIAGPFQTLSLAQFQQQRLPQVLGLHPPLSILLFPQ